MIDVDAAPVRRRVEGPDDSASGTKAALRPGVEGSRDLSIREGSRPEPEEALTRRLLIHRVRIAAGAKLVLGGAVGCAFFALFLQSANDLYLGAASTALTLVAYSLAEHDLGRGRGLR